MLDMLQTAKISVRENIGLYIITIYNVLFYMWLMYTECHID